jgi:hypothetical protein
MDAGTLIVSALVAGAAAGTSGVVNTAISDAYQGLKRLVAALLGRAGKNPSLVDDAPRSEATQTQLAEELNAIGINEELGRAAEDLLELVKPQQGGKFVVDASQAKGVVIGDHSVQHNTFS